MTYEVLSSLVESGVSLDDAFREVVHDIVENAELTNLTDPEIEALRVTTGLSDKWASDDIGRGERKQEVARLLWGDTGARTIRRVEQKERELFARSVDSVLRAASVEPDESLLGDRTRAIFAQSVNPEVLAAYGQVIASVKPEDWLAQIVATTRIALLATTSYVIYPASYLYEVPGFSEFLAGASELREVGAVRLTGAIADRDAYRESKRLEYRDLAENPYDREPARLDAAHETVWEPRKAGTSTASDIARDWRRVLVPGGELSGLIATASKVSDVGVALAAAELRTVPEKLNGRAFIGQFVFATGAIPRTNSSRALVSAFLSQRYLLSYLQSLDANMLIDFPTGMYSVGLDHGLVRHQPRLVRVSRILQTLDWLGIKEVLLQNCRWPDLLSLSRSPEFEIVYGSLIGRRDPRALQALVRLRDEWRGDATDVEEARGRIDKVARRLTG